MSSELSDDAYEEIERKISALEADPGAMGDWERGFIADQRKRLTQYGKGTFFSAKQLAKIKSIYDEVVGDEKPDEESDENADNVPF